MVDRIVGHQWLQAFAPLSMEVRLEGLRPFQPYNFKFYPLVFER